MSKVYVHSWRELSYRLWLCQEPHCQARARWSLKINGARSEELLCDDCAYRIAHNFGLTEPPTKEAAGDDLHV